MITALNTDVKYVINPNNYSVLKESYTFQLLLFTVNQTNPARPQIDRLQQIQFNDEKIRATEPGKKLQATSKEVYFLSETKNSSQTFLNAVHLSSLDQFSSQIPQVIKYKLPQSWTYKAFSLHEPSNQVFLLGKTGPNRNDYAVLEYDLENQQLGKKRSQLCQDAKDLSVDPTGQYIFISCRFSVVVLKTIDLSLVSTSFSFRAPETISFGR